MYSSCSITCTSPRLTALPSDGRRLWSPHLRPPTYWDTLSPNSTVKCIPPIDVPTFKIDNMTIAMGGGVIVRRGRGGIGVWVWTMDPCLSILRLCPLMCALTGVCHPTKPENQLLESRFVYFCFCWILPGNSLLTLTDVVIFSTFTYIFYKFSYWFCDISQKWCIEYVKWIIE